MSSQQDLDRLLHQLLHLAKENTGAGYAALGVFNDNTREAIQFLIAGVIDAAAHAIQTLPLEQGSQESRVHGDGILRLAHLAEHWTTPGFPADHAPMTSSSACRFDAIVNSSAGFLSPTKRHHTVLRPTSANWTNKWC